MIPNLSTQTLKRLPVYIQYLKTLQVDEIPYISSTTIAKSLGLNDVQVRKDLALVSGVGKPKVGYETKVLISDLESALGWDSCDNAVLVGAGKLGQALLTYKGFKTYGLDIIAAFDSDPSLDGTLIGGKQVFSMAKFYSLCQRMGIKVGIITVPADSAQRVCDIMVSSGIKAIWNFAPIHLKIPEGVLLHNENMAASLALLTSHLRQNT